ncbi:MAG: Ig-like domain-containing protein [Puniceicoccaceae bacterium]
MASSSLGYAQFSWTGVEITHAGNTEFDLSFDPGGSKPVVITLSGVLGETVSFKTRVTSSVDNVTGTFYFRWINTSQFDPDLDYYDLAQATLSFGTSPDPQEFDAGTFVPVEEGDYHFEIRDGNNNLVKFYGRNFITVKVVDSEIGEISDVVLRGLVDGNTLNVTQPITLSAYVYPSIMREYVSVDYFITHDSRVVSNPQKYAGYKITNAPITFGEGGEFFEFVWETPYITGDNPLYITAYAQMSNGSFDFSEPVQVNIVGIGSDPIVTISAAPGDDWTVGSDAQFTVQASDSGALVETIEFFVNGRLTGDPITEAYANSPWTFDFKFPSSGPYDIWAIATFSNGNKAISNILEYDIKQGREPFVYLISPAPGMQFLPGTTLPILASAWDPNSLIDELKYYINDTLVQTMARKDDGTFDPDPITFDYNFPFAGNYRIYVQATDEGGLIAQSEVVQVVVRDLDSRLPRVVMSHPLPVGGGDTVNDVSVGSSMYLNAIATDGDGRIERVNFYINSQLIGSSSASYNDTFAMFFAPTTAGNYVMFAEAVDNSGNRMHSPPLRLNVYPLEAQLPRVKILPLPDRYQNLDAGSEITVSVEVDGGLVDVNQVNYYLNGVLVDSQDETDEGNEDVFTATFTVNAPGTHLISARAIEIDPLGLTTDNWMISDPVGIRVNPPSDDRGFVERVYLSILGVAPSRSVLDAAVFALNNGQITRAQYVYDLMTSEIYQPTLLALMARYLLTGEWPDRNMLNSDIRAVNVSLPAFVNQHLPTFQTRYWDNQRLPDGFSSDRDFRNFFRALWLNKHGVEPTKAQTDRAVMQMKVFFLEDFVAEFVRDVDAMIFGSGTISTLLGIPNPPNSLLEDRAFVASLFGHLLHVRPSVDEVEALLPLTQIQQIEAVLADPRF